MNGSCFTERDRAQVAICHACCAVAVDLPVLSRDVYFLVGLGNTISRLQAHMAWFLYVWDHGLLLHTLWQQISGHLACMLACCTWLAHALMRCAFSCGAGRYKSSRRHTWHVIGMSGMSACCFAPCGRGPGAICHVCCAVAVELSIPH